MGLVNYVYLSDTSSARNCAPEKPVDDERKFVASGFEAYFTLCSTCVHDLNLTGASPRNLNRFCSLEIVGSGTSSMNHFPSGSSARDNVSWLCGIPSKFKLLRLLYPSTVFSEIWPHL